MQKKGWKDNKIELSLKMKIKNNERVKNRIWVWKIKRMAECLTDYIIKKGFNEQKD